MERGTEALRSQYLMEDSFLTGDLKRWTSIWGTWTWQPITRVLRGDIIGSNIRTNRSLTNLYAVEARIITIVPGVGIINAGMLLPKWIDINNHLGFQLMTDGRARLWWWKGGVYNRILAVTVLSCLNWHLFRVELRGTNALGFIDGVLYCNATHADISMGAGYPGLQTDASTADFDDFKEWGIRQ